MPREHVRRAFRKALAEAALWALFAAVATIWLCSSCPQALATGNVGATWFDRLFIADFASRWSGQIPGWTEATNIVAIVGDLAISAAYTLIGFSMLRLHPLWRKLRVAPLALRFVVAIFLACAYDHFLSACCHIWPVYRLLETFKIVEGFVAIAGSALIAAALANAFVELKTVKAKCERIEAEESLRSRHHPLPC
jgi:hypothetical protein